LYDYSIDASDLYTWSHVSLILIGTISSYLSYLSISMYLPDNILFLEYIILFDNAFYGVLFFSDYVINVTVLF
jgi:hypothetical protein